MLLEEHMHCDLWCIRFFILVILRLAKLLFQRELNFCVQRRKGSSGRTTLSAPQLRFSSQFDQKNNNAVKELTCSHSQEKISPKQGIYWCVYYVCIFVFCICVHAEVKSLR